MSSDPKTKKKCFGLLVSLNISALRAVYYILVTWAGKMNLILRCDWLTEQAPGLPAVSLRQEKISTLRRYFWKCIFLIPWCKISTLFLLVAMDYILHLRTDK